MTPHAYGRHAALLLFGDPSEVRPWLAALEAEPPDGVVDVIAGAASVVVVGDPARTDAARLIAAALQVGGSGQHAAEILQVGEQGAPLEVPVVYEGEDLDEVARRGGLDVDEVVRLHSEADYEVAFCGFSPGFAYLTGLPEQLHLPRRDTPRPRVPAGSVAIAAGYSAVYPQASPGGWWLLGRTTLEIWDVERDPPALLRPGMRVRFTPVPR